MFIIYIMEEQIKKLEKAITKLLYGDKHFIGVMDAIEYPYDKNQFEEDAEDVYMELEHLSRLVSMKEDPTTI